MYSSIKRELVQRGVDEDDIAFVHDYKTNEQRASLFRAVNDGDIRVVIGSTGKLGVGVNMNQRMAALHHLDVPWRPRDIEQREGRIIRQGNEGYGPRFNDEKVKVDEGRGIKIYNYLQEKSFDTFMWQALEKKAVPIKSLMRRQNISREIDDVSPFVLSIAEAKALASGNPLAVRAEEVKQKVEMGRLAAEAFNKRQSTARMSRSALQADVSRWEGLLPLQEADAARAAASAGDFRITIDGDVYDKRADAAEALTARLRQLPANAPQQIGSLYGFDLLGMKSDRGWNLVIRGDGEYMSDHLNEEGIASTGVVTRAENVVKGIAKRAEQTREKIATGQANINAYTQTAGRDFAEAAELEFYEKQLASIRARLEGRDDPNPGLDIDAEWEGPAPSATSTEPPALMDTDADGIPNRSDLDADGDGTADAVDESPPGPSNMAGGPVPSARDGAGETVATAPAEPPRERAEAPVEPSDEESPTESADEPPAQRVETARRRLDAVDAANAADPTLAGDDDAYEAAYQEYQAARYAADPTLGDKSLADIMAEREDDDPEPRKKSSAEMFEDAKSGPVALTGPGSIMERLAEERATEQQSDIPTEIPEPSAEPSINAQYGALAQRVGYDQTFINAVANSDDQNARIEFDYALDRAALSLIEDSPALYDALQDKDRRKQVADLLYKRARAVAIQNAPGDPDVPDDPDDEPMTTAELKEAMAKTRERWEREDMERAWREEREAEERAAAAGPDVPEELREEYDALDAQMREKAVVPPPIGEDQERIAVEGKVVGGTAADEPAEDEDEEEPDEAETATVEAAAEPDVTVPPSPVPVTPPAPPQRITMADLTRSVEPKRKAKPAKPRKPAAPALSSNLADEVARIVRQGGLYDEEGVQEVITEELKFNRSKYLTTTAAKPKQSDVLRAVIQQLDTDPGNAVLDKSTGRYWPRARSRM
ncbi:MAG: hypothetical protein F4X54_07720 [Chloroflexi bacterium]|nr:hypothetical protein [Chloroflexota bacterium]